MGLPISQPLWRRALQVPETQRRAVLDLRSRSALRGSDDSRMIEWAALDGGKLEAGLMGSMRVSVVSE
jgi:hypothetical protein